MICALRLLLEHKLLYQSMAANDHESIEPDLKHQLEQERVEFRAPSYFVFKHPLLRVLLLLVYSQVVCARPTMFPYQQGWLGGDAAYSVILPDKRVMWLFGDTFIGPPWQTDTRIGSQLVSNSIGTYQTDTRGWQYYWRVDGVLPQPFFKNERPDEIYWPRAATLYKDTVIVFLLAGEKAE